MKSIFFIFITIFLLPYSSFMANDMSKKILVIGDSHTVGYFGEKLHSLLLKLPHTEIVTLAICGSNPIHWLKGRKLDICDRERRGTDIDAPLPASFVPHLATILKEEKPHITIIAHGTNYVGYPPYSIHKYSLATINLILLNQSSCFWVGPPDAYAIEQSLLEQTSQLIQDAGSGNCQFFNSLEVTSYPPDLNDGVHYSLDLAHQWAKKVFDGFTQHFFPHYPISE